MSRKNQDKTSIGDKIIYNVKTPNGWSIIIMPDNILIDNYHIGKAHIHPNPEKHSEKIELSKQDQNEIFEIIKDYLQITGKLDISELVEMLK
ncbi:hypothetical protein [Methanobrevibacter sp.]|uniref:hypothetical protein n=1 Tax=Methanobrevibacter sp. TaxID=66852 RepID=UPI00388F7365